MTFPEVSAVVDNGMKNRAFTKDGFGYLATVHTSQATRQQRKGRVGRINPLLRDLRVNDLYVDRSGLPPKQRQRFPTPQIQLVAPESILLKFKASGRDAPWNSFPNHPDRREIDRATQTLKALGLLGTSESITSLGLAASQVTCVTPFLAKMIAHAYGTAPLGNVQASSYLGGYACSTAALIEAKGILSGESFHWQGLDKVEKETESDLFRELLLYEHAKLVVAVDTSGRRQMAKNILASLGVDYEALCRTIRIENNIRRQLGQDAPISELGVDPTPVRNHLPFDAIRYDLKKIVIHSMYHGLYVRENQTFTNLRGDNRRELPRSSVLSRRGNQPNLIVGVPFTFDRSIAATSHENQERFGGFRRLLFTTAVPSDFEFSKGDLQKIRFINQPVSERIRRGFNGRSRRNKHHSRVDNMQRGGY